jgi:hypothetical protein
MYFPLFLLCVFCLRFPKPSVVNLPPVTEEKISKEIEFIYELIVALGMGSNYYGTLPPENEEQVNINFVNACASTVVFVPLNSVLIVFAFSAASSWLRTTLYCTKHNVFYAHISTWMQALRG